MGVIPKRKPVRLTAWDYSSQGAYFVTICTRGKEMLLAVRACANGSSQAPNPTNAAVPKFVSLFKRRVNRSCGEKLWQRSYHDHIIRDEADFRRIWEYIDTNPAKWREDCFFCE